MASIHVLKGSTNNRYTVVVHAATPAGNNSAGVSWVDALKNSGTLTSVMKLGNGAGLITQNELNGVEGGTIIEGVFQWDDNPAWTNTERQADLDLRATQLINDMLANYSQSLKYFGFTRG